MTARSVCFIVADHCSRVFRIVGECYINFRSPLHDVIVRQNETGFIDDETCSCTLATTSIFRQAKPIKEVGRQPRNLGNLASAALPASALPRAGAIDQDLYYCGIQLSGNLGKGIGQGYRVRDGNCGGFLFEGRFHSTRHDVPMMTPIPRVKATMPRKSNRLLFIFQTPQNAK